MKITQLIRQISKEEIRSELEDITKDNPVVNSRGELGRYGAYELKSLIGKEYIAIRRAKKNKYVLILLYRRERDGKFYPFKII